MFSAITRSCKRRHFILSIKTADYNLSHKNKFLSLKGKENTYPWNCIIPFTLAQVSMQNIEAFAHEYKRITCFKKSDIILNLYSELVNWEIEVSEYVWISFTFKLLIFAFFRTNQDKKIFIKKVNIMLHFWVISYTFSHMVSLIKYAEI